LPGAEGGGQEQGHRLDDVELGVLIGRNVVGDRPGLPDLLKPAQLLAERPGLGHILGQHGYRIGAIGIVLDEVEIGSHRFRLGVPEVERIEIEAGPGQRQGGQHRQQQRPRQHRPGMGAKPAGDGIGKTATAGVAPPGANGHQGQQRR